MLSRAAKRIVVLVLVVGAIAGVGSTVASAITAARSTETLRELQGNHEELLAASQRYEFDTQNCAFTGDGLPCLQQANERLAQAFDDFAARLREQSFPAYSIEAARRLERATERTAQSLRALSDAASPAEYQARAIEFQNAAIAFDEAFADLLFTLP